MKYKYSVRELLVDFFSKPHISNNYMINMLKKKSDKNYCKYQYSRSKLVSRVMYLFGNPKDTHWLGIRNQIVDDLLFKIKKDKFDIGDEYWYLSDSGDVFKSLYDGEEIDQFRCKINNMFKTEFEAKERLKEINLTK